jgi:hypothetical protein
MLGRSENMLWEGWLKCGVTQDKGDRAQEGRSANGDKGFLRVAPVCSTSRDCLWIAYHYAVCARVGKGIVGFCLQLYWATKPRIHCRSRRAAGGSI